MLEIMVAESAAIIPPHPLQTAPYQIILLVVMVVESAAIGIPPHPSPMIMSGIIALKITWVALLV